MLRGGFRLDWEASGKDAFTFQGDIYDGDVSVESYPLTDTPPYFDFFEEDDPVAGGNLLGRWTHQFSDRSESSLQLYYDRTERTTGGDFCELRDTVDVDFQHSFSLGDRHALVGGLGYRRTADEIGGIAFATFVPDTRNDERLSAFLQDEITLIEERLALILGAKVEHNDYTEFEYQPSARLSWTLSERQHAWASVSRAIRTPSRSEEDMLLSVETTPPKCDIPRITSRYPSHYRQRPSQFRRNDRLRIGVSRSTDKGLLHRCGRVLHGQ